MRIKVKTEGRNINIPLPMWLIKAGVKISTVVGKNQAKKALSKNTNMTVDNTNMNTKSSKNSNAMKYIDMIDYKILKEVLDDLGEYKGLVLVEVYSKDGTEVLITV